MPRKLHPINPAYELIRQLYTQERTGEGYSIKYLKSAYIQYNEPGDRIQPAFKVTKNSDFEFCLYIPRIGNSYFVFDGIVVGEQSAEKYACWLSEVFKILRTLHY
jgi:hypothetical protein